MLQMCLLCVRTAVWQISAAFPSLSLQSDSAALRLDVPRGHCHLQMCWTTVLHLGCPEPAAWTCLAVERDDYIKSSQKIELWL